MLNYHKANMLLVIRPWTLCLHETDCLWWTVCLLNISRHGAANPAATAEKFTATHYVVTHLMLICNYNKRSSAAAEKEGSSD